MSDAATGKPGHAGSAGVFDTPGPEPQRVASRDGMLLHAELWRATRPQGTVVISHGLGEHAGRYAHVARAIAGGAVPFDVLAFDYRGHGQSPGRRGSLRHFDDLLADLGGVVDFVRREGRKRPVHVLGHSLGALQALRLAMDEPENVDGLILSAPAFRLIARVPAWKRALGQVLRVAAPGLPIAGSLPPDWLSTAPGYAEARRADPLVHSLICARVYYGMKTWGARLLREAAQIQQPVLLILGGHDRVVCRESAQIFLARVSSKVAHLCLCAESAHEPLNDIQQAKALRAIESWLTETLELAPP